MKALVTGASGFLGSWLVRALVQKGDDVSILCRESSDLSELEGIPFNKKIGDVTDPSSINNACQATDIVYHLAGLIAYKKSDRSKMERINVGGTKNIIDAVAKNEVEKLVHFSSVTAIGSSFDGVPLNEESPYNMSKLNLGYWETKKESEDLVVRATKEQRIRSVIINPSTVYGAGDAKKGSRNSQIKVAQGRMPFFTNGGVNVVPVENVVAGVLAASSKGKNGERYILSGENITIEELFRKIAKFAGVDPPDKKTPKLVGPYDRGCWDVSHQIGIKMPLNGESAWAATLFHWYDSKKAQEELGFDPGTADQAIENSVNWMKENRIL